MEARVLDDILATDNRIRYAGILGGDLKMAASKTRDDVKLMLEKEHVDHLLVDLAAPVMIGALSRFSDTCGKLICCSVRYDRVTLMFFKQDEMYVVMSTEPGPICHNAETGRKVPSPAM